MSLEEAARAYHRAEKALEERRAALAEAIVEADRAGRKQVEIVQVSGYAREHVRRIIRAAEKAAAAASGEQYGCGECGAPISGAGPGTVAEQHNRSDGSRCPGSYQPVVRLSKED